MNNNKKWRSRRLWIAIVAWVAVTVFAFFGVYHGADFQWFSVYTYATVLLAFFSIGGLTATDVIKGLKGGTDEQGE